MKRYLVAILALLLGVVSCQELYEEPTNVSPGVRDNEIWLTSASGSYVCPDFSKFNVDLVSIIEYEDKIICTFSGPVTTIMEGAFSGDSSCYDLQSVTLPKTVHTIEPKAFTNCERLKYFYGDLATLDGAAIVINGKMCAFAPAWSDEYTYSYVVEAGVRDIADHLFENNQRLQHITFPASLETIGNYAFAQCSVEFVVFDSESSKMRTIGEYAFYSSNIKTIELPSSTFTIGNQAFMSCHQLSNIILPDSLAIISKQLCYECNSLQYVHLPNSLREIKACAFSGCSELISVDIPAGIENIGDEAFGYNYSLREIYCRATVPPTLHDEYVFTNGGQEFTFYLPKGYSKVYAKSPIWSQYADSFMDYDFDAGKISPDLSLYGENQKIYYTASSAISIYNEKDFGADIICNIWDESTMEGVILFEEDVTTIPESAFSYCNALESITIPESVKSLGSNALNHCQNLRTIFCKALTPPTGHSNMFGSLEADFTIYVPYTVANKYKEANYWSDYADSIVAYDFEKDEIYEVVEPVVVTLKDYGYFRVADIAKYEDWKFLAASEYSGKMIYPIELDIKPANHGAYTFAVYESTQGYSDDDYRDMLISKIADEGSKSAKYDYTIMTYNTTYHIVAIAADANGQYSDVVKREVKCSYSGVNYSATAFIEWWEEMSGLAPSLIIAESLPVAATAASYEISYEIQNEDKSLSVDATTDTAWITNLTVSESARKLLFDVEANDTAEERVGAIEVTYGRMAYTIAISQAPKVQSYEMTYTVNNSYKLSSIENYNWNATILSHEWDSSRSCWVVTFDRTITYVPEEAFANKSALMSITLPATVKRIETRAFLSCYALEDITLPQGVEYIGNNCFYDCDSLTEFIIPDSVTEMGENVFNQCNKLSSLTIGSGLETLPNNMCDSCFALENITIPSTVKTIGENAFYNCNGPARLDIPASVTTIGAYAFYGLDNLEEVYFHGSLPPACGTCIFSAINELYIYVPSQSFSAYTSSSYEGLSECRQRMIAYDYGANKPLFYELRYRTSDDEIIDYYFYVDDFGATFIDQKYDSSEDCIVMRFNAPVTEIPDNAFDRESTLLSIDIPNSVKTIGQSAFLVCKNLTTLTIPSSVQSIADNAFSASGLQSIVIPDSVTSIGGHLFSGCESLSEITIGNGITALPDGMFYNCPKLKRLDLPENISAIGNSAINHCTSLKEVYCRAKVPPTVSGDQYTFLYDSSPELKVYVWSTSLKAYREASGWNYYADLIIGYDFTTGSIPGCDIAYTTTDKKILEVYTTAGFGASFIEHRFDSSTGRGVLAFDGPVMSIPAQAFVACTNLATIELSNNIITIGDKAFFGCSAMTEIIIPESVTSIGVEAFKGCGGKAIINCAIADESSGRGDFYNAKFTEVVFGGSATQIGTYAFEDCTNLKSIDFGSRVITIGSNAFEGCTSLSSVTLPDTITSMGSGCFYDCSNLESVTLGNGIDTVAYYAFGKCSKLKTINFGSSVNTISYEAFEECTSLQSVVIPDTVTTIGSYAFNLCSSLNSITFGSSVTSVGSYAFRECTALTNVYVDSIEEWCAIAFESYQSNPLYFASNFYVNGVRTTEIIIPDSVTDIKQYAFNFFKGLTKITLGKRVTSISYGALRECSNLAEIYCKAMTPPSLYSYVFDGLPTNAMFYVPMESVEDYKSANGWSDYAANIVGYDFNTSSDTTITPGGGIADAEEDDEVIM